MKKFCVILFIVVCLAVNFFYKEGELSLSGCEKICLVASQINGENDVLETMADDFLVVDKIGEDVDVYDYKAVIFYLKSSYEKVVEELNVQIDYSENIDGKRVYYGFTNQYKNYIDLNNKKINIQIVENGEDLIVGLPMIVSGF